MHCFKEYELRVPRFKKTSSVTSFLLDKKFFDLFESDLVKEAQLRAHVTIQPHLSLFTLLIEIEGTVTLVCDRSLNKFNFPIEVKEEIMVKWGEETTLEDDYSVRIDPHATQLNVAQHFYDFVVLKIPFKKIHPLLEQEETGLLYSVG